MAIQVAFGEWEPSFFGVTLQFSGVRAWQTYRRLLYGEIDPVDNLPPAEHFENLAVVSATAHEMRHFHDSLLSPYCAQIAAQRMNMLANALQLFALLTDQGYEILPVPLGAWCRKSIENREAWLSENLNDVPGRVIPLPYTGSPASVHSGRYLKNLDGIAALILACQRADNNIEQIITYSRYTFSDGTFFQPWHVMELAAVDAQIEEISRVRGWNATEFFLKYLAQSGTAYGRLLSLYPRLGGKEGDHRTVLAMATWSMLGSYEEDKNYAMPSERLNRLIAVADEGRIELSGAISDLFDQWSEQTGMSRVESGVQEAKSVYQRIATNLKNLPFKTLVRVGTGLEKASEHATNWFLNNQERYSTPASYLDVHSELPNPSVRIVFGDSGLPLEQDQAEMEAQGWKFPWILEAEEGPVATTILTPFRASSLIFMSDEDTNEIADLVDAARFLVSEKGRSQVKLKRFGNVYFSRKGLRPIEIF